MKKVPKNETKSKKFVRLAEFRMTKIFERFRLLRQLANNSNYAWKKTHVDQMVAALENEIKVLKAEYNEADGLETPNFLFKGIKS